MLESLHAFVAGGNDGESVVYGQKIKDVNGMFERLVECLERPGLNNDDRR